jgi:hypothetical protein
MSTSVLATPSDAGVSTETVGSYCPLSCGQAPDPLDQLADLRTDHQAVDRRCPHSPQQAGFRSADDDRGSVVNATHRICIGLVMFPILASP